MGKHINLTHEIEALAYACFVMPTTEKGTVTQIYVEALVLCPSFSLSLLNRLATRFTYGLTRTIIA